MDHVIAFLQFREINVQRGTSGFGVWRLEPARSLDFVTAKNFRIGDDDQFCFIEEKAARKTSRMQSRTMILQIFLFCETVLLPNLLKPLPLAVIVAKNMHRIILSQPTMQLREKFTALRLSHVRLRLALRQRAECIQTLEVRSGQCEIGTGIGQVCLSVSYFQDSHAFALGACFKDFP